MARLILFIAVVAALVAAGVWFAERPGDVTINWLGWRVDTTVPILFLLLLGTLALLGVIYRAIAYVGSMPRRVAASRKESRQRKGYLALTDGLAAVAAGDAQLARKQARKADHLLHNPPLTLLLSAQAAQLGGEADEAKKHFAAMLDRPETAFLGLRGLLTQALKEGDQAAALDYARRAHAMNPEAGWLAATLFDLQARAGLWKEAQETLDTALRHKAFSQTEGQHKRAVVLHERAGLAAAEGDRRTAIKLAREAHNADPSLVAASLRLAELYVAEGKPKKAAAALEESWSARQHPQVAAAYMALWSEEDALQRVKRAEKLAAAAPDAAESDLLVGEAALEAQLWGQARKRLNAGVEKKPSARAYRTLAQVEEQESGDSAAGRDWLAKAAEAPAERVWLCRQCGTLPQTWSALCGHCGAFDSIVWTDPLHAPADTNTLLPTDKANPVP